MRDVSEDYKVICDVTPLDAHNDLGANINYDIVFYLGSNDIIRLMCQGIMLW